MVTLHSHTSHALQPLDVTCFKPFNTTFKKEKNTIMINKNYIELDKIVLADGWTKHYTKHSQEKNHVRVQKYRDLAVGP
jgi:methionine aminopeptidase